ncbi:MAG: CoA transferase [Acidimicrobiia bacterium]
MPTPPSFKRSPQGPLADVRVLAIEQYGAGPFGSLQLAELGAEVIKIEDPSVGGDVGREVPPFASGGDSLFFQTFNHNKKSITLDLKSSAGRHLFEQLVPTADVVYSNLRGDVPERLRIRYEDLSHLNPAIVCCSLSAFGVTGPRRGEPGYDYIIQGMAGWMSLTGEPTSPPAKSGLSLVDLSAGYVAALSIVAGLHAARNTGVGCDCDISLLDTAISLLSYVGTWYLTEGYETERLAQSAHPTLVPFQAFQTQDGWIVIAVPKEKFFVRLAAAIGMPQLGDDPRFADFAGRESHRGELLEILAGVFAGSTTSDWIERLNQAEVPVGPVNRLSEAFDEPAVEARQMITDFQHDEFGTVRLLRSAARVGDYNPVPIPGPSIGQHTVEILNEIGISAEEIASLGLQGAFGPAGLDSPLEATRAGTQ